MTSNPLPTIADVFSAMTTLRGVVRRTPVLTSSYFDEALGKQVFFKCENLQHTGAFKYRGASNAVRSLSDADARRGVATHSSGNHGAALAAAAQSRGIASHVVVPKGAPERKLENIESYGARVYRCENTLKAREEMLAEVVAATGALAIHPYENAHVIAGQGTAALELLEEQSELDVIVAPVGGGGLLAGTSLVAEGSGVRVVGAEPEEADDAARSLASGVRVTEQSTTTVADGLRTLLGAPNFEILKPRVSAILTVSESEIIAAMRLMWTHLNVLVEPSAAVPVAALLRHGVEGERVGVIISGGNVSLDRLPW